MVCSMCLKKETKSNKHILSPMQCVQKYGSRAHKICTECWFSKFAIEGGNHKCPGCKKKLKLTNVKKSDLPEVVINLT